MANEIDKTNAPRVSKLPMSRVGSNAINTMLITTLGDEKVANSVTANLMATVSNNPALKECECGSPVGCALMAHSLNLSASQSLGYCAFVPFNNGKEGVKKAQFQLQYKGYVQLAMRSGMYNEMDVKPVYADQLNGYDDFGNEKFDWSKKKNGEPVGYLAYFTLTNGFRKALYMSKEDCLKHANRYSKSYKYDKNGTSLWNTMQDLMCEKTVLKQLLSRWGVLSIDLQNGIENDQKVFINETESEYLDNPANATETPAEATKKATTVKNTILPANEPKNEENAYEDPLEGIVED